MLDVVIIGAGGFGREVYQWAKAALPKDQYRIKGFVSCNPGDLDGFGLEVGMVGDDVNYVPQENERFLLAIGSVATRKIMAERFKAKGARFLTLIHPTAVVAETATLGEGVVLCPFTLVSDHAKLGDFVVLNNYASCGHDVQVGDHCVLSPYSTLNGFAILEDDVFLGTHATVTGKRKVGTGSQISANSVAMYSVPEYHLVVGVPGKSAPAMVRRK